MKDKGEYQVYTTTRGQSNRCRLMTDHSLLITNSEVFAKSKRRISRCMAALFLELDPHKSNLDLNNNTAYSEVSSTNNSSIKSRGSLWIDYNKRSKVTMTRWHLVRIISTAFITT